MILNAHKILLVDDDPNDIELVQLAMKDLPYIHKLDVLSDGEQTVNYLIGSEGHRTVIELPRLVLMDLKLPKLTGIEVLRAIRTNDHTRKLPVVIMTSSSEETDVNVCYELGVNSYVVKPLDFQSFQEIVRQLASYWMTINYPASIFEPPRER